MLPHSLKISNHRYEPHRDHGISNAQAATVKETARQPVNVGPSAREMVNRAVDLASLQLPHEASPRLRSESLTPCTPAAPLCRSDPLGSRGRRTHAALCRQQRPASARNACRPSSAISRGRTHGRCHLQGWRVVSLSPVEFELPTPSDQLDSSGERTGVSAKRSGDVDRSLTPRHKPSIVDRLASTMADLGLTPASPSAPRGGRERVSCWHPVAAQLGLHIHPVGEAVGAKLWHVGQLERKAERMQRRLQGMDQRRQSFMLCGASA
jgi:hypothetical protein